ncbi:serine hydrolase domain-containing protein [Arsenicibacter rosenii]|uniref:Serine hydrolase n=1 Tax=Arsenicibacter rosenii TaxID=1750698 RepID=A0A1S2VPK0_9BACT|nr:serine hydrolase domain-containing protein [Arsenicibacter rosenii]OIN60697.1 serine hydrolase [Arsenicibacter rosenii]
MKQTYLLLFCPLVIACQTQDVPQQQAGTCAPDAYAQHPAHQTYQAELVQYRLATHAPGSVMRIVRPGEAIWQGVAGQSNLEHQTAMRNCDQFRVGSITKMFVAVAVMKLREQGKLSLDEKLAQALPGMAGKIPQATQITIRQLLSHTSGIIDPPNAGMTYQLNIVSQAAAHYNKTIDQLLTEYVYGKPLQFAPGTGFSYSNANYWILQQIIESKTGKPLQSVLSEVIFGPLQLNNTYLERRDDRNVVRGYADLYGNGTLFDVSSWDRAEDDGKAAGGIISTAADLTTFLSGLFGGKLLSAASVSEMIDSVKLPACPNGDCEYGLGMEKWFTGAGIAYGHNGGSVGFEANLLYFVENKGIFMLYKNNGNGSDKRLMDRLMK